MATQNEQVRSTSETRWGADPECRQAFVAMIRDENFYMEPYSRQSLKQHWSGAPGGFADKQLQRRWRDFEAGWKARTPEQEEVEG